MRVREGWFIPLGAVLLMVCGLIAVAGFPLDDMWHRLFGQDVTLWGPTHIQMVGGAALSTLALWVLVVEGMRETRELGAPITRSLRAQETAIAGAFLIGLSALQAEFDYSVPQFRLLFHPVLLALAAGIALVPARIRLGRGGALKAVVFFLLVRGVLSVVVGPLFGHTTLHFPLYIASALVVELVALGVNPSRHISFGVWAGLGIGVIGLAAESVWSDVWMTMSWPAELVPEVLVAVVAGVAGGALGGLIGRALSGEPDREHVSIFVPVLTGAVILFCLVYPLPIADKDMRATVTVETPDRPTSSLDIQLDPPRLAEHAKWFNVTSWQGGGSYVVPLDFRGGGRYHSEPVPISGEWKTLIRFHSGSAVVALPIYLPEDPAIPAHGVPAEAKFTRDFVLDKQILLREAKDTPQWMSIAGYSILGLIVLVWIAALGWGLRRMRDDGSASNQRREVGWNSKASTT